jgi:hypothetical protein
MTKPHDLFDAVGQRFGCWTILAPAKTKWGSAHVSCRCDCGTIKDVEYRNLLRARSLSCGCSRAPRIRERSYKHGGGGTRLYGIWHGMNRRCGNPRAVHYERYGGRGIAVCVEWREDFECFRAWAISAGYTDDKEIDRINNHGNYQPDNCRWASRKENARNTSRTVLLTAFGETKPISAWAEDDRSVVSSYALNSRLKRGWSPEDAIMRPSKVKIH